jgi:hypothetical protein
MEMTRYIWTITLVMLAVGGTAAEAIEVLSDPIAVWDDDENNWVSDVVYNPEQGEFLVLFVNYHPDSCDIFARRIANDGTVLSWFAVSGAAGEYHRDARAAYNPDRDEYLVVWTREQDTGTRDDIFVRTVSWNGGSMGPVLGTAVDAEDQVDPDVAYNYLDGEYLVVYHNQWDFEYNDIAAQRLQASDLSLQAWENVASGSAEHRRSPRVAYHGGENNYLIAYTRDQDGISAKIAAADLAGVSAAPEITIIDAPGCLISYSLGLAVGPSEYLVAWTHRDVASEITVRARRVTIAGLPLGPAAGFLVNDGLEGWASYTSIEVSYGSYGDFVLAWDAVNLLSTWYDVDGAVVHPGSDATSAGPVTVEGGLGTQASCSIDCAPSGQCLVAYSDDYTQGVQTDLDVRARMFRPVVFGDGFESGDSSGWSLPVP